MASTAGSSAAGSEVVNLGLQIILLEMLPAKPTCDGSGNGNNAGNYILL
jgi:hypothetical protein